MQGTFAITEKLKKNTNANPNYPQNLMDLWSNQGRLHQKISQEFIRNFLSNPADKLIKQRCNVTALAEANNEPSTTQPSSALCTDAYQVFSYA